MKLVMTLLCRNEADIIASMIRFHLGLGVDLILVTDNASTDGTSSILESFTTDGRVKVFHEPSLTHDQGVWVTRMARLAANNYGADWLIHADADEFWMPASGDLKCYFAKLPPTIEAMAVQRSNFIPPPLQAIDTGAFQEIQTIRERRSLNSLGNPLPPKVCHRAHSKVEVSDGNHAIALPGRPEVTPTAVSDLEILHFPVRSYRQFERKICQGAQALERNVRLDLKVGNTWRRLYHEEYLQGRLPHYYASLVPDSATLKARLEEGNLIRDTRLKMKLASND